MKVFNNFKKPDWTQLRRANKKPVEAMTEVRGVPEAAKAAAPAPKPVEAPKPIEAPKPVEAAPAPAPEPEIAPELEEAAEPVAEESPVVANDESKKFKSDKKIR